MRLKPVSPYSGARAWTFFRNHGNNNITAWSMQPLDRRQVAGPSDMQQTYLSARSLEKL